MLDTLLKENWQAHLGDAFDLMADGTNKVELTLVDVTGFGHRPGLKREGYSLLFSGPLAPIFHQCIYRLSHSVLGELDLFLVPIGPESGNMRYEAVFN